MNSNSSKPANSDALSKAIKAGLLYSSGVFVAGFALGGIRMMLLIPYLGEYWSVMLELPIILGISWILCAKSIARFEVPGKYQLRLIMGATAFSCLIFAELIFWVLMFDTGSESFIDRYQTSAGLAGLTGQLLFALIPLFQQGGDSLEVKNPE